MELLAWELRLLDADTAVPEFNWGGPEGWGGPEAGSHSPRRGRAGMPAEFEKREGRAYAQRREGR